MRTEANLQKDNNTGKPNLKSTLKNIIEIFIIYGYLFLNLQIVVGLCILYIG